MSRGTDAVIITPQYQYSIHFLYNSRQISCSSKNENNSNDSSSHFIITCRKHIAATQTTQITVYTNVIYQLQ